MTNHGDVRPLVQRAVALFQQGKLAEAQGHCEQALQTSPDYFDALHLLGVISCEGGALDRGLELLTKATGINPLGAEAHNDRGHALLQLRRLDEALAACDKAVELKPDLAIAHNNRGNVLRAFERFAESLTSYDNAIRLDQNYAAAYHNRGRALQALAQFEKAIASYGKAIQLRPDFAEAYGSRGYVLLMLKRYEEAAASYEKAIALNPNTPFVRGPRLHAKAYICDWRHWEDETAKLREMLANGRKASPPFPVFALLASRSHQLSAARAWAADRCPRNIALPRLSRTSTRPARLRIGYFSSDFREHAVALSIAETIEKHDRSRFEIIGFSLRDANDDMRRRLRAAFDQFIDVQSRSDRDVALLARRLGIDIAVDLQGFTGGSRTNIFALRAAPLQVCYQGYPGTMGADFIDYLVADPTVIPAEHRQDYAEKIAYLPDNYHANDAGRQISDRVFTRAELGLPPQGFVFCCFNNSYKITPEVFDDWMAILARVPGSVLWLSGTGALAMTNLRREAEQHGVAGDRLVFAERLEALPDHLARHRLADLFLDTLPFNAHGTASDALWAGLPVLTRIGETFAGRVAASFLTAIGLPELITTSRQAYRDLAVELATHPGKLQALRRKLAANRLTTPLFDTGRYVRHLEAAYEAMYARHEAGLPPDHIQVPPLDRPKKGSANEAHDRREPREQIERAIALFQQGKLAEAQGHCEQVLKSSPGYFDALHLLGVIACREGQLDRGLELLDKAIGINPRDAEAHNDRGNALRKLQRVDEAIASFDKAIELNPGHALIHNNRALALQDLRRLDDALASFDKAIQLRPDYAAAYNSRGLVLQDLGRPDQAIASFGKAIKLRPDFAEAYGNRAFALRRGLKRHEEALADDEKALALDPDAPFALGPRLHAKSFVCNWQDWEKDTARLREMLDDGRKASTPFSVLSLPVSRRHQLRAARTWTADRCPPNNALPALPKAATAPPDRLRIGYFSSDFMQHPIAWWIGELIEKHDRSRFEIIGFSLRDANDDMRRRLRAGFDRFIDVQNQSDREVALLARRLGINIAVDLNGFTTSSRSNIFALRAGPIQVNYLGYPGTMGADFIDYLVADPTVIPAEHRQDYAEKVVYLPDTYQPNDTRKPISDRAFTRAELGLTQDGFVFCCFNNTYKITPEVFDDWMAILASVPGSVLWLLETSALAMANLRREAGQRGVAAERLAFAKRMPLPEHLARHRMADLFLDTLPYNAHTTASEALWAGLPVLTRQGETFAGRVAASLLKAIGAPELITTSRQAYRDLAVELATHPGKLQALSRKLAANRLTTPLFDTGRYVRHLEAAYEAMYARHEAGLPPDHIQVQPVDRPPNGLANDQPR